ncbi:Rhomboid protein 1 mitochondrial [Spathaspora sp. JA1]|nr:Rhomboid protein 1 mitochondrial [Spathaspora sp. JA1]
MLQRYTMQYGIMFKDNLQSVWTMLGSAFSHQSFYHLLFNMFALQSFGSTLCTVLGATNFTILYLNSAVISSFAALAIPTLMRSSLSFATLGASGAVFSVFAAFSYLIPKAPIAIFFFPIPGGAWMLFLGTLAWNAAGTVLKWGVYDYAGHIGGSLVGLAYAYWYTIKRKEQLRKRQLRWY